MSKQPNFPSREGTSERLSCIWETPQQPPTLQWIEAPADFDSTVGFYSGFGSKPRGGGSRCFTQTPKKKHQTAFLQNYGDGWLEPTTKRCAFCQKGWAFQQDTIHPVKNFAALLQRLSKPAQNIRAGKKTPWDDPPPWMPAWSLLHIPYSKKGHDGWKQGWKWSVFGRCRILWPPCGETCHRYVFWRLEIWTIFEDLMGRTMGSDASKDHQLGEYPWACPPSSDHKYHHNHH